mgnify:FL=1
MTGQQAEGLTAGDISTVYDGLSPHPSQLLNEAVSIV